MKPKSVAILAGVAVVAVGLAAWSIGGPRGGSKPTEEAPKGARLFPELSVNDVAAVEVTKAGQTITINRGERDWSVAEKGGYPAKFESVKATVVGVSELEPIEAKTENPELYTRIGVEDPSAPEAKSTLVTLKGAGGTVLASLIVGQEQWEGNTQCVFVRKAGDAKSWKAKGKLGLPVDTLGWMERQITSISRDRVKSVTITQPETGETLTVSRDSKDQRDFKVHDTPEGRELTYATVASPIGGALSYLMFEDVAPASDLGEGAVAGPTAEFRTFDGVVATVASATRAGKQWIRLSFSFDESVVPAAADPAGPETPPAEGEAAPPDNEAAKAEAEKVRKEVEDLNAKLAEWDFVVSQSSARNFTMKMEDLLKPLPAPAPIDAGEGTPQEPAGQTPPVPPIGEPK